MYGFTETKRKQKNEWDGNMHQIFPLLLVNDLRMVRNLTIAFFSSCGGCKILSAGQYLKFLKLSSTGKYASGMFGVGGSVALLFLVD